MKDRDFLLISWMTKSRLKALTQLGNWYMTRFDQEQHTNYMNNLKNPALRQKQLFLKELILDSKSLMMTWIIFTKNWFIAIHKRPAFFETSKLILKETSTGLSSSSFITFNLKSTKTTTKNNRRSMKQPSMEF